MMRKVWIDAWQMQCCGDPFHVGQRVEFATVPPTDLAFLGRVLGEEGAARLTDREDRHDAGEGPPTRIAGVVQGIEAISCRFEPMGHPVTGTTHLEAREHAAGRERADADGSCRLVGYVVTMATDDDQVG